MLAALLAAAGAGANTSACAVYAVHLVDWRLHSRPRRPRVGELFITSAAHSDAATSTGCKALLDEPVTHVEACSAELRAAASAASVPARRLAVLLAVGDQPRAPLLSQVESVLRQLHAAHVHGLVPHVLIGRRAFVAAACSPHDNRYYSHAAGDNVWEYYFERASTVRLGAAASGRQPRIFVAAADGAVGSGGDGSASALAEDAAAAAADASGAPGASGEPVGRLPPKVMAHLLRRYVRVRREVLRAAGRQLRPWRSRSDALLGVALGGSGASRDALEPFYLYVDAYVNAHPGGLVLLADGGLAEAAAFRARYGERLVAADAEAGCEHLRGGSTDEDEGEAADGPCEGASELLSALLLAHTDYMIAGGTGSVAEFAKWYNPYLIDGHIDVGGAEPPPRSLPGWAGGRWLPPEDIAAHATRMLEALGDAPPAPAADAAVPGSSSAAPPFEPGLAPPPRLRGHTASPWAPIASGKCAGSGGRIMTKAECEGYARSERLHFLGASVDRNEYGGCNKWDDTGDVEFNEHTDEAAGCNLQGRGHCVCIRKG